MPIIPTVGRKSWKSRFVMLALYFALSVGAVTMVYPFLTMVFTGMTSSVEKGSSVPKYIFDTEQVFAKFAEDKFADSPEEINYAYAMGVANSSEVKPPNRPEQKPLIGKWREFVKKLGPLDYNIGFRVTPTRPISLLNEKYQTHTRKKFNDDIDTLNAAFREENYLFETLEPPADQLHRRDFAYRNDPKVADWVEFKQTLPQEFRNPVMGARIYQDYLKGQYDGDVKRLNAEWGTRYTTIQQIPFTANAPTNPKERAKWEEAIREKIPYRYLLIDGKPADHGLDIDNADQRTALQAKLEHLPIASIQLQTPDIRFAREQGVSESAVVGIAGTSDWQHVQENLGPLRKEFATRNYRFVLNYILLHGRAVWVTVFFCLMAVITALIVNPLCAYALSRYPMRSTGRILMFVLATMAFPAEVALIPSFLLLKQLGLLNTYWALILPTVASGFSIFLLKGFFDSLPKELYEAGTIDGASEMKMFARVTLPLSKPIFAVIALQSFLGAYGAFMYAFLVCQDPRMWTIMVWLYELQVRAPKFVIFAGLTLAALPSLAVFLLAQNVIMRGIILPSEK